MKQSKLRYCYVSKANSSTFMMGVRRTCVSPAREKVFGDSFYVLFLALRGTLMFLQFYLRAGLAHLRDGLLSGSRSGHRIHLLKKTVGGRTGASLGRKYRSRSLWDFASSLLNKISLIPGIDHTAYHINQKGSNLFLISRFNFCQ